MFDFIGKLGGRAFVVAFIGLVAVIVTATSGLSVSDEMKKIVIEAIMGIVSAHSIGRGLADGFSGGKTSSAAAVNAPPDAADASSAKDAG